MKPSLSSRLVLALMLFVAVGPLRAAHRSAGRITHQGRERSYTLVSPEHQDGPVPLILALHGAGGAGLGMERLSGLSEGVDREEYAVVYPDGVRRTWKLFGPLRPRRLIARVLVDDVGFLTSLIDRLVAESGVDPGRVFAVGISNGAYMCERLAQAIPDRLAGIGLVAGTTPRRSAKRDVVPMPVMQIHGTGDPIVSYEGVDRLTGRRLSMAVEAYLAWRVEVNGASPDGLTATVPGTDGRVTRITHGGRHPVIHYRISEGGHGWPGHGFTGRDLGFDATAVLCRFFLRDLRPPSSGP